MNETVQIGTIFVDAGIVMVGDPCYTLPDSGSHRTDVAKNWDAFCNATYSKGEHQSGNRAGECSAPLGKGIALVVASGYGDGEYPVFVEYDGSTIARLIVEFIPDDDDDDDDDDNEHYV